MSKNVIWLVSVFSALSLCSAGCGDDGGGEGDTVKAENTSVLCQDGIDNDGNGAADCDDAGCADFSFCAEPADGKENTLSACQDGEDNDGDGKIDCADTECQAFAICQKAEEGEENTLAACQDGDDNDGDGKIDCDDVECQAFAICQKAEEGKENTLATCQDGEDNDGDGKIDCDDVECQSFTVCQKGEDNKENTLSACQDGTDNDGDGKIDCEDTECQIFAVCSEDKTEPENTLSACQDGKDNDGDGKIDCEDDECRAFTVCENGVPVPETTQELCSDGIDNDNNGKTDCEEPSCIAFAYCAPYLVKENSPELCSDGIDNDNNGLIDCMDASCKTLPVCTSGGKIGENTPELCKDGLDNDDDGKIDCADPECADYEFCQGAAVSGNASEDTCTDGKDNDGDGLIDCADADCQKLTEVCIDACPDDPYKFVEDKCKCGETLKDGECYKNITSAEEFKNITRTGKHILKKDIDFGEVNNEGFVYYPLTETSFSGVLDGNFKRISGVFHKNVTDGSNEYSLFRSADGATFRDISLGITLNVKQFKIKPETYVGVIAGLSRNSKYINVSGNSKVYYEVNSKSVKLGENYSYHVGGLVGKSDGDQFEMIELIGNTSVFYKQYNNYDSGIMYLPTQYVGGLVGETNGTIQSVHMKSNLTVDSDITENYREKADGNDAYADIANYFGGIAGKADKMDHVSNDGVVKINTKLNYAYQSYSDYYKKWNDVSWGMYDTNIGGIAGEINHITDGAFTGKIVLNPKENQQSFSNYSIDINVGGLVGKAGANANVYDSLYENASIHLMLNSLNEKIINAGGIIGNLNAEKNAVYVINGYAHSKLFLLNDSSDSFARHLYINWGGIAGSAGSKGNIINNHAGTEYVVSQWMNPDRYLKNATDLSIELSGAVGKKENGTVVNTFIYGNFDEKADEKALNTYGSLPAAANGKFLYESYWNEDVYTSDPGSLLVDASALPYAFNPNGMPMTLDINALVLNLLNLNSGHDGGVLSANIPRYIDGKQMLYSSWKYMTDKKGRKLPVPVSKYGIY